MIAIGIVILIGSIVLGIGVAWLSSLNQTSGAPVMGALLLGCAGVGLGFLLIAIGVLTG